MFKKYHILLIFTALFTLTLACQKQVLRSTPVPAASKETGTLKSPYSVVYLDLDGTALDTSDTVRPATITAVQAFKARGGRVGIATGRTFEQAQFALEQIRPNLPVVLFNGGMIADPPNRRFTVLGHLDKETLQQCRAGFANDSTIQGMILHFPVVSIPDRNTPEFNNVAHEHHITLTFRADLAELSPDSLVKIVLICPKGTTEQVQNKIHTLLVHSQIQTSRVVISSPISVEILPLTINKAVAIRKIADQVGFAPDQVVAFGDSGNDIEMLRELGLGVAMGNGRLEVQAVSDLIIGPNYTDAIAKFLNSPFMR